MNFPSIGSLLNILVDLAWKVTEYYFFVGDWDDVEDETARLRAWYEQLKRWVSYYADHAADAFRDWTSDWIDYLNDWRDWLKQQADWAKSRIDNYLTPLYNWYNQWKSRLQYIADKVYSWLKWFFEDPTNAINYYLAGYLAAIITWFKDPLTAIKRYLGSAWTWLYNFYSNPWSYIRPLLGSAWDWLVAFWNSPLGTIERYLGAAWTWLRNLFNNPLSVIEAILGAIWAWLKILYGLRDFNLFGFIRDALTYWYTIWRDYRVNLLQFLSNPVTYVLAAIRDAFLDWLEELIAENW